MNKNDFVLSFNDIRATDLPLVGGKGANLGEMTHAGFPIPTGFCVTTVAFKQFIASCPEMPRLYELLDTVNSNDLESARTVGQTIRQTLLDVSIPQTIADAVTDCWQHLGVSEAYAVRSSATAEDLPDASFAGQQDTYLNIIGQDSLLDAIRRCWVSLFTDRAILYRCQNGFPHQGVQLSVVVQQMIMAEKSGILFTADPLTGHRHTVAIDASYGLGEALVSGIVSPDAYHVDKRNQQIIERQIADKQIAIYPEKDGGTRQESLSDAQRTSVVLSDEQIIALANLGSQVEAHYGVPQDIEWAIADDEFYLLQARPITSLYPIDGLVSPDDSLHIFASMGHQQNMTNAMYPLSISTMQCAVPIGREHKAIESSFAHSNGGRLFADITMPLRHPIARRGLLAVISQFDALAPQALKTAMQRLEFQKGKGLHLPFSFIPKILKMLYRVVSAVIWEDLSGLSTRVNDIMAHHMAEVKAKIKSARSDEAQILAMIEVLHTFFGVVFRWAHYFIAGEIAKRALLKIGHAWEDEIELDALDLGLSGNVVVEMNLTIGDLADVARRSPELVTLFDDLGNDGQVWLEQAEKADNSQAFMRAWEKFIADYGARGSSEIDIAMPKWYEEPLSLLQVIANYLKQEEGNHRKQHKKLVNAREKATEQLIHKSKRGVSGWLRVRIVRRLLHVMSEASVLREHHKFLIIQIFGTIKETLKSMAVSLTENNILAKPDDIWFLTWTELLALARGDNLNTRDLVTERRKNFARYQKMTPPVVLTSDGETPVVKYQVADAPEGALVGQPVSAGIAEGIVRIIHDPQTETLHAGEILVAPFTDPGWTPLFINASGLIMEVGGIMTHGSVVAREYSIPAVVGVRSATTELKTGQRVRLDGNRGVIEIL